MTFDEAYTLLSERWPGQTFCLGHEVWHHDHSDSTGDPSTRTEEYKVWSGTEGKRFLGLTLRDAVDLALNRTVGHFPAEAADAQDRDIESRIAREREGA